MRSAAGHTKPDMLATAGCDVRQSLTSGSPIFQHSSVQLSLATQKRVLTTRSTGRSGNVQADYYHPKNTADFRIFQVDPLDAGTDNGFTFTSPNWPTEPQAGDWLPELTNNTAPSMIWLNFWKAEPDFFTLKEPRNRFQRTDSANLCSLA